MDTISNFGSFSGYKINLLKSEAMPLSKSHSHDPTISHPFKWSPTGFVYLGIKITPNLESLYKSNFAPIFKNIRSDLDRWCNLPLSLVGRVHLVKMNILPRLLYPFQMLPVLIPNKALKQLRELIISFIWRKKRPRLRYNFLTLPSRCGGLAAPDIKLYQLSAQLRFILEWHLNDPNSTWISAEAITLGPVPLWNLLYLSPKNQLILIKDTFILKNMIKIWRLARKIAGLDAHLSLLTPLHNNPDFPPGMKDGLIHLRDKGIHVIGDLIENKQLITFEQFTAKYDLNRKFFLTYQQIRSFISYPSGLCVSPMEEQFNKLTSSRSASKIFYSILIRANTDSSDKTRVLWRKDFEEIQITDWETICHGTLGSTVERTSSGSKCRSNVTLIITKADTVQKQN